MRSGPISTPASATEPAQPRVTAHAAIRSVVPMSERPLSRTSTRLALLAPELIGADSPQGRRDTAQQG